MELPAMFGIEDEILIVGFDNSTADLKEHYAKYYRYTERRIWN